TVGGRPGARRAVRLDRGLGRRRARLVQHCGLAVVLLALAAPFLRRLRVPFEVWLLGTTAALLNLALHQFSELGVKMAFVAAVVSCLVAVAVVRGLLTAHRRAYRLAGGLLAGLLGVNALFSTSLAANWVYSTLRFTPTVSRDELNLLRWVRTNTS